MSSAVFTEISPSRTHRSENFPVASLLFPAVIRAEILAFYSFARSADDIADCSTLTADERLQRLNSAEASLRQQAPVWMPHALILLQAFRYDVQVKRHPDWQTLLLYCSSSAVPVGRFLLELYQESPTSHAAVDSLCIALQILNHLQDCGTDYQSLDRIYLPQEDMKSYGVDEEMLAKQRATPELCNLINVLLDRVVLLLLQAQDLLPALTSSRLRLQASVTLTMAEALAQKLRTHDPLRKTVKLSKTQICVYTICGLWRGWKQPVPR